MWVAPRLRMTTTHQKVLQEEVLLATELMDRGNLDGAFRHLERVHVLGQTNVRWHVLAHWLMLKIAIRRGRGIAAIGQAARIVLGAIGSAVGIIPTGNTGGSDVSMFARMPIAPDLLRVMHLQHVPAQHLDHCFSPEHVVSSKQEVGDRSDGAILRQ